MNPREKHDLMANAIRFLSMDAVERANSGHPGLPMGAADIATVLFSQFLTFDPTEPDWADRDRFVLSAGHGSMLLYSLLYLTGYEDIDIDELRNFRQLGSKTAGHPEFGHAAGIEATTGPLGQGLSNAVGMALAERILNAEYGDALVDHYTYVLAGDGCLMEGISQEAITLAGHLALSRMIVFWDNNNITIDGEISLSDSTDQIGRFQAAGWNTLSIDGHDPDAIAEAIETAKASDRPTMIAAKTTIGLGAPTKAGTSKAHGSPLGAEEIAQVRTGSKWAHEPFDIPSDILDAWRLAGLRSGKARKEWAKRLDKQDTEIKASFQRRMAGKLPASLDGVFARYKEKLVEEMPTMASRKSSEAVLEVINEAVPETIGGSADLTGSNNTKTGNQAVISAGEYGGRYVHYGIREHGMAAAMNGLALHGGVIPYGGTFLVFSDYCRPSMRLSSLMGLRVIYVMTHDSIGLGEDGPTHQPVEHLASLRAIPNHQVMRPADAMETAECWQLALESEHTPSTLALSRQNLEAVRDSVEDDNLCSYGAYNLVAEPDADVTIFASGSEVSIALGAKRLLEKAGHSTRIVSVPCFSLFEEQSEDYQRTIIGSSPVRIAVEAGVRQGWDKFIGSDGIFVGMTSFGASGAYKDLYAHFGITEEAVAEAAEKKLHAAKA